MMATSKKNRPMKPRRPPTDSRLAMLAASTEPRTRYGPQRLTICQSTLLPRLCSQAAAADVHTIQAREVATAQSMASLGGSSSSQSKSRVSSGTMTTPPPIPNRPPRKPLNSPSRRQQAIKKICRFSSNVAPLHESLLKVDHRQQRLKRPMQSPWPKHSRKPIHRGWLTLVLAPHVDADSNGACGHGQTSQRRPLRR